MATLRRTGWRNPYAKPIGLVIENVVHKVFVSGTTFNQSLSRGTRLSRLAGHRRRSAIRPSAPRKSLK
jgi:hypothetical protein